MLWDAFRLPERYELIFDINRIYGPRAHQHYAALAMTIEEKYPNESQILPVDVMFRDDKEFLPLQAADLIVGCIRRGADQDGKYQWLHDDLPDVNWSSGSHYYDEQLMRRIVDGAFEDALANNYAKIFG